MSVFKAEHYWQTSFHCSGCRRHIWEYETKTLYKHPDGGIYCYACAHPEEHQHQQGQAQQAKNRRAKIRARKRKFFANSSTAGRVFSDKPAII